MLTAAEVLELVPHRRPFRFIDRVLALGDGRAVGEYTFHEDEPFYAGHFPGNPVTPGVVLIETMAQTGLVVLGLHLLGLEEPIERVREATTWLTESQVEIEHVVRPGATVHVTAERLSWRRRKLKSRVELALADGTPVARGTLAGMLVNRAR